MKIIKYTYVDLYYNEDEMEKALKERKRLEKLGYTLEAEDDAGGPFQYCDQFHRYSKGCKDDL